MSPKNSQRTRFMLVRREHKFKIIIGFKTTVSYCFIRKMGTDACEAIG